MNEITIQQIPDHVYRALTARAERDAVSIEDTARKLIADGLLPPDPSGPGDLLHDLWQGAGRDVAFPRDRAPVRGATFD